MKNQNHRPHIPIQPIPAEPDALPFSTVSTDLITKLPESDGFDSIAVFIDHDVTKAAVLVPCREAMTADDFSTLYEANVFRRFGLPKKLISDRGTQFTSKWFATLCLRLGISQAKTTAYHPQADGQTERLNQEVEQYLRIFCNHRQDNWARLLPLAEFSHNATLQASLKTTPFQALMGYTPRAHIAPSAVADTPGVTHRLDNLERLRKDLQASHRLAAQHMADRITNAPPHYKENDKVWLDATNLRTSHPASKLAPKRYGPFKVTSVLGPVTFALALPPTWKIHPVFHASYLSPYRTTEANGPTPPPPLPDLVNNEEQWEVDKIVDSHRYRNQLQYLVHWKGYSDADDTWEPMGNVQGTADAAIADFHKRHPQALRPHPTSAGIPSDGRNPRLPHSAPKGTTAPRRSTRGKDIQTEKGTTIQPPNGTSSIATRRGRRV